eukprot:342052-Prymnesium_polylepis.1
MRHTRTGGAARGLAGALHRDAVEFGIFRRDVADLQQARGLVGAHAHVLRHQRAAAGRVQPVDAAVPRFGAGTQPGVGLGVGVGRG